MNPVNLCEPLSGKGSHYKTAGREQGVNPCVNLVNLFTGRVWDWCNRVHTRPPLSVGQKGSQGSRDPPNADAIRGLSHVNLSRQGVHRVHKVHATPPIPPPADHTASRIAR